MLLTGRCRPLDREAIITRIWARARAGRERRGDDPPLVVVATQCIEAGADLDFDGLVTECASLDALKQRFGRLDRLGALRNSRAIIIARSDALDEDPVYGGAIGRTWKWLEKEAKRPRRRRGVAAQDAPSLVDFGAAHLPVPTGSEIEGLLAQRPDAPVLLPAHLDAWAITSPRPAVDPDVGLWLHGISDEAADVQVVWRSDLPARRPDSWADIVALCPPGSSNFAAGLASDAAGSEKELKYTALCVITGDSHQHFLGFRRDLREQVTAGQLKSALFASWRYRDQGRSFRWDPTEDRRYALRASDPSKGREREIPAMWGANRLAFEALACLPCFPSGRRVRTTAFEDERVIRWPLWTPPIDLRTVRSLLAHPAVVRRDALTLERMGVFAIASSRRSSVGRKRTFGPASLWPVPHA